MTAPRPVLITGGAVRLGRGLAEAFAATGHDVAVHYGRSAAAAQETVAALRTKGVRAEAFQADLADPQALSSLMDAVTTVFPDLGGLVNSASAYDAAPIAETDAALFDSQFAVNLRAPFLLTKAFAAAVDEGFVVNILDNKIAYNQYAYAAYLLSKKALAAFTPMAAMEFAPRIRVNGVAPGVVLPAGSRAPDYVAWRIEGIPLKKQGDVAHIAQAVLALAYNDFTTGQIISIDGGENSAHIGRNFEDYQS